MIPQATSVVSFAQLVGGTLGISIGGTIFSNQLVHNLGPLAGELGADTVRAVRESVIVVFHLPEPMRDQVIDAYIQSLATMFIIFVPCLFVAGLFGFLVKDWNLKIRGGAF
jgi:hypothetical protein